jgi:hypothetical protein
VPDEEGRSLLSRVAIVVLEYVGVVLNPGTQYRGQVIAQIRRAVPRM